MNMFARFDENPAMTLRVIKETKRYGRTDGRTDARTHRRTDGRTDNVKTVYPLQTKFAGGIISDSEMQDLIKLCYQTVRSQMSWYHNILNDRGEDNHK